MTWSYSQEAWNLVSSWSLVGDPAVSAFKNLLVLMICEVARRRASGTLSS